MTTASRGTTDFVINPVPQGRGGTRQRLSATITRGTGVYRITRYRWTVSDGILDPQFGSNSVVSTATSPTWTKPSLNSVISVDITLEIRFIGEKDINTGETPEFTITKTVTTSVTPYNGAINLSLASNFRILGNFQKTAIYGIALRPEIPEYVTPPNQRRFLSSIAVQQLREPASIIVTLLPNREGNSPGVDDLTDEFEEKGVIRINISGTNYRFPMNSQDTSEPYTITQPASTVAAFFAAWQGPGTMFFEIPGFSMFRSGTEYTKVVFGGNDYTKLVYDGHTYGG